MLLFFAIVLLSKQMQNGLSYPYPGIYVFNNNNNNETVLI